MCFSILGQVNLCSLNCLLETVFLPFAGRNMKQSSIPRKGAVLVMLGQSFKVQPHLSTNFALDFPMELESKLVTISRSSVVKRVTLTEIRTGSVVVSVLQKLVHMDLATKKSCELSSKILALCSNVRSADDHDIFKVIVSPEPASNAFSSTQMVKHSDMDYLMHTNQGTYMKFAFDCFAEAAAKNAFSFIKDDICRYKALAANTLHMSETFAGDILDVKVWDDDADPFILNCAIFKNKVNVYYLNIQMTDSMM